MKDFLKKLMGFSLGPIIGAIISFITVPITARLVSAEQFGLSNMFVVANSIITLIVLVGIDQAFVREYNETSNRKKLLYNSLIIPLTVATIIGIFLIAFRSQFAQMLFNDKLIVKPIILLAICTPLFIIENFMLSSLRMQEKAMKYSLCCIGSKLLNLVLTLVFLLFYKRNFESIIYATIFSQLIMSVLLVYLSRGSISISRSNFDKKQISTLFKYGLPLLPATLIGWGLNSMDSIFLRTMSTYTELGYYSVALKVSNVLGIIQTSFTTFWTPVAFKWKAQKENNEKFELVSKSVSLIMSIVFVLILLFKNIIPLIFGKNYEKIIYILPFLMFYPIFYTISETTSLGISFSKKTAYNILVSGISIIINTILNYVLIPIYGAIGAALATGVSYIVFFWIKTLISRKLWYMFKVKDFAFTTVILLAISILNLIIKDIITVTIINIITLGLILVIYRELLIKLFKDIKSKI